jgi:hypothetical protein
MLWPVVVGLQGRRALPSLRYMKLIREGAKDFGLAPDYQAWLAGLQHYVAERPGQKLGALLFKAFAYSFIFPIWAGERLGRTWLIVPAWVGCWVCAMRDMELIHPA